MNTRVLLVRDFAKRFNPDLERIFKRGDARPKKIVTKKYAQDGRVFQSYVKTKIDAGGFYHESWVLPQDTLIKKRAVAAKIKDEIELASIRKRLKDNIIEEW